MFLNYSTIIHRNFKTHSITAKLKTTGQSHLDHRQRRSYQFATKCMNAPICFNYTENLTGIFNRITEGLRAKCYLLANSIIMPVCCYTLWSVNLCFIISLGNKDIEVKELALIFESVGFFFLRFFLMWNVFKVFLECVTMLLLASVLCFGLWP